MYLREVKVKNGIVRGLPAADPRITAFKGIPFAAPPVGDLRWRAPQPAKDWEGVLEAYHFGPISMQEVPGLDPNAFYSKEWNVDPTIPMSEDCLQLNVWTPAKTGDEKLPVMVWIYGGGLRVGNTQEMEFDGERIARRGVILVTVNYRLNAFGFLAHPELTAEDPDYPTNFGHLDQRAGIQWVKDNIAAFGGDPENITIFGQSAGGGSTYVQVASPLNKGLFKRAVCQSMGGFLFPQLECDDLAAAEKQGEKFLAALGVSTIEEARKLDANVINEFINTPEGRAYRFVTVTGDKMVPDNPAYMVYEGKHNDVALMTGFTGNEFFVTPFANDEAELEEYAREYYGDRADDFLAVCKKGAANIDEMKQNGKYSRFETGVLMWMDRCAEVPGRDIYAYKFNPEMPGDDAGAFHSSELWFTFETLAKCWRPFQGKHYDLARLMCNYWTNFAKNGDPNGLDNDGSPMPEWKPVTCKDDCNYMFFGDTAHMANDERSDIQNFAVSYYTDMVANRKPVKFPNPRRQSDKN